MDCIPLEQPIVDLEEKIVLLRRMASTQSLNLDADIKKLERQVEELRTQIFSHLTAYETVQLSRHPMRPNGLDIIGRICTTFIECHGDRNFFDDPAIVGGLAQLDDWRVVVITHQKGHGTNDNIARNFGMPKPEGYRKALRLMQLATKFNLPIITLIDTPGAYPGVGAEERGPVRSYRAQYYDDGSIAKCQSLPSSLAKAAAVEHWQSVSLTASTCLPMPSTRSSRLKAVPQFC